MYVSCVDGKWYISVNINTSRKYHRLSWQYVLDDGVYMRELVGDIQEAILLLLEFKIVTRMVNEQT